MFGNRKIVSMVSLVVLTLGTSAMAATPSGGSSRPSAAPKATMPAGCKPAMRNAAVNCGATVVGAGLSCGAGPVGCAVGSAVAVGVCANEAVNVRQACKPSPARRATKAR